MTGNMGPQGGVNLVIHGSGAVVSGVARTAQVAGLSGTYGFQTSASPTPGSISGVLTFDGAGNVTESATIVGAPGNTLTLPVTTGTFTGTYTINSDGSGVMNLTNNTTTGQAVNISIGFVIVDGGSGLLVLELTTGANVRFGSARMQ